MKERRKDVICVDSIMYDTNVQYSRHSCEVFTTSTHDGWWWLLARVWPYCVRLLTELQAAELFGLCIISCLSASIAMQLSGSIREYTQSIHLKSQWVALHYKFTCHLWKLHNFGHIKMQKVCSTLSAIEYCSFN